MEEKSCCLPNKASSLRWTILRQALLRTNLNRPDKQSETVIRAISRRTNRGFNMIPFAAVDNQLGDKSDSCSKNNISANSGNICVCYTLPFDGAPKLLLHKRAESFADLNDFEISNRYDIDNTGLVCQWPSEDVLAYYCLSHTEMFRDKKVIELGAGYGLGGLVIAVTTEASEIVISDGNPQVVDYIQCNINANSCAFGSTKVKPMILHWKSEEISDVSHTFDIIIASDCTFFKEFHRDLAQTVKRLLRNGKQPEAFFFSPRRGNSLNEFLKNVREVGLDFSVTEVYDEQVWGRHKGFINGDSSWPNYEEDHCYPLLVKITY